MPLQYTCGSSLDNYVLGEVVSSDYCNLSLMCHFYCFFNLDAGLPATSQYYEGPMTGHLDTGFSWFPVPKSKC